jgi:hypothetical protein
MFASPTRELKNGSQLSKERERLEVVKKASFK